MCSTMPPTSWTSKWRIPNTRTEASRQTAKASGSTLSSDSPLAMRSRNSGVLACSCASDRACIWGSSALIFATMRWSCLSRRSLRLPKTPVSKRLSMGVPVFWDLDERGAAPAAGSRKRKKGAGRPFWQRVIVRGDASGGYQARSGGSPRPGSRPRGPRIAPPRDGLRPPRGHKVSAHRPRGLPEAPVTGAIAARSLPQGAWRAPGSECPRRCLHALALSVLLAEELARVEHAPFLPDLEMHVRAGRTPGRSGLGDLLAAAHQVADLHHQPRVVRVAGDVAVAVVDLHHLA